MAAPTSLSGPVEKLDGQLFLRIPLAAGGNELVDCSRGIGSVANGMLIVEILPWLAEKLKICEGSLVTVDNRKGKFNIESRPKEEPIKSHSQLRGYNAPLRGCPRKFDGRNPMRRSHEAGARICFAIGMVASIALFGRAIGVDSPWFAVIVSFCILGLLDLARPFARTRMPRFLREVRPWESRGSIYRTLGVRAFGEMLRRTPFRLLNRRVYLKEHSRDLSAVRIPIEDAEAAHFWGGVATIPYLLAAWSQGWWAALTSVVLFNLIMNVFPILHLRTVRARIDHAMSKMPLRYLARKNG